MCDSIFPNTWGIDKTESLFPYTPGSLNPPPDPQQNSSGFPQFPLGQDFTMQSTKDIGNNYYNNNKVLDNVDGVTVYLDPEHKFKDILLEEIIIDDNKFYKEFDDLDIVLFASRDGARLLEQYQRVKATSKQIVLFLEIDDRTNYFGSVMHIQIGSDVEKMQSLPFREISQFVRSKKVDLSEKEVKDFIEKGIRSGKNGVLKFLMRVFSKTLQVTSFIFDGLGDFFDKTIPEKLDFFRISEERWNGEKNLLFFPDSLIEFLKGNESTKEQNKALDKAFTSFHKQIDEISNTALECVALLKPFFPRLVYNKVKAVIDKIIGYVEDFKKYLKEHKTLFVDLLVTSIKMINAMLCGFLNSMVDFVKGIFQVIGIIFKIVAEILDFADNIAFYTEYIVEIIENFIGVLIAIDYPSFFKELINAPAKLVKSISNFLKDGIDLNINIDWVSTAYYYGYIVGLIIQTILEILFTGGTVTVAKLAEYLKAPFVAIGNLLKASIGAAKTLFQKILSFIDFIISKLKNPKQLLDDFIKFVDELLTGTKKEVGISETVAQEDLLASWDKVTGRSRRLGQKLSETDLKKLIRYLKKFSYELEIFPEKGSFVVKDYFSPDGSEAIFSQGAQAAFIYTNKNGRLLIREGATMYEVFHELIHAKHSKSIGLQKYKAMGGRGTDGELIKENLVFFKIIDNKELFTRAELEDALKYINDGIYRPRGIDPISFDFDIEAIPLVRKEIKIEKILNIK